MESFTHLFNHLGVFGKLTLLIGVVPLGIGLDRCPR